MAAAPIALDIASDFKPDNTIITYVSMLKGPTNFPIWSVHMQSIL